MLVALIAGSALAQGAPDPVPAPPPPPVAPDPAPPEVPPPDPPPPTPVEPAPIEPVPLPEPVPTGPALGGQTFPGLMNPSMSFNGLFVGGLELDDGEVGDPHLGGEAGEAAFPGAGETYGTGLNVQEMELQILSNVDPYFKANAVLALPGLEGIEIEEGYVQLVSVPRLLLTVGKLKEAFGRENLTHTHALLTVDKSLIGQRVLGAEGLNDVAVQAAILLPTPFFSEVTVAVDRGTNEVLYGSGEPEGLGTMAHLKNQVDLTYGTSLELGLSGATGLDAFGGRTVAGGADVTMKGHGRGRHQWNRVVWQNEYLVMSRPDAPQDPQLGGLYSTFEYSLNRRTWVGGRFDAVGLPAPPDQGQTLAGSLIAVFAPSEFSSIRVQGQHQAVDGGHTVDSIVAQLAFSVGVHPVHSY